MTAGTILRAAKVFSPKAAKGMTALGLASAECANHRNDGCLGNNIPGPPIGPGRDQWFTMPLPKCLVAMRLPCDYFERCLLPLARKKAEFAGAEQEYARKMNPLFVAGKTGRLGLADALDAIEDDALRARLWRHPFIVYAAGTEPAQRVCPDCRAPLPKRARYCTACAEKRNKANRRAASRRDRQRGSAVIS